MKTGMFAIDYMQVGLLSVGSAELAGGPDGQISAQITILAPDGEFYSYYWLQVGADNSRIEYIHFDEFEGEMVQAGEWSIEDASVVGSIDEADLLAGFAEMTRVARDLDIRPLELGLEIETLGGPLDRETLVELGPLWAPN